MGPVRTVAVLAVVACALAACASPPIETDVVADERSPASVAAEPDAASGEVLWGGVIVDTRNNDADTELEILAYPLDRRQRPMTGRPPEGRFIAVADGYLESVDYAPGRLVTVLGSLEGVVEGQIGEARRVYPNVRSRSLHLWRPGAPDDAGPRFSLGIGFEL